LGAGPGHPSLKKDRVETKVAVREWLKSGGVDSLYKLNTTYTRRVWWGKLHPALAKTPAMPITENLDRDQIDVAPQSM